MSIEEQIEQALAEGRRIKDRSYDLLWFVQRAFHWAISADTRSIAFDIVIAAERGTPTEALAYRCYDLAIRVQLDEQETYIASCAREVMKQVNPTCQI